MTSPASSKPVETPVDNAFVVITGPCVLEGDGTLNMETAHALHRITQTMGVQFYFKSSYDKANRTSVTAYRGPGLTQGLRMLAKIKETVGVPLLTDVHTVEEAREAARVVDMIQIPAFLCRQTDLLMAAGETGIPVNIKKGQFLSPHDIRHAADKVKSTGNPNVWITERGNSFGYNTLVVDMRSIPIVQSYGLPIIFDATHSVQQPGGLGTASGGDRQYAPTLARAAVAAGCNGLFLETHPNPDQGLSDGPNMIPLAEVEDLLKTCLRIRAAIVGNAQPERVTA